MENNIILKSDDFKYLLEDEHFRISRQLKQ